MVVILTCAYMFLPSFPFRSFYEMLDFCTREPRLATPIFFEHRAVMCLGNSDTLIFTGCNDARTF